MLQKIAEITGLRFNEQDTIAMQLLNRIANKLPEGTTENDANFEQLVQDAENAVDQEGQLAIVALVKMITAPPPEKVLKIKSSPKGARIKIASATGVRFSFGPIWNESVKKGKGIALVEANRAKLNHQGLMSGVANPEKMAVTDLAAAIAATL